jgi:hypothetical protein
VRWEWSWLENQALYSVILLRISVISAFRIFSRSRTAFDGRRSTQAFQVFINTSVIQDKTLTIYINFGKFGSENWKCGMHISVKCAVRRFSSPRTKLLAARCECLHLIKINGLALWFDENWKSAFILWYRT